MNSKNSIWILVFILILNISINLDFISSQNYPIGLDPWYHVSVSKDIQESSNVVYEHPFDRTYPNTYTYNFHILIAIFSSFTGVPVEFSFLIFSFLIGLLIVLVSYMLAKVVFNKRIALFSSLLSATLLTNFQVGGLLLSRPQIVIDLFLFVVFYFCFIIFYKKNNTKSNILVLGLFLFSSFYYHPYFGFLNLVVISIFYFTHLKKNLKIFVFYSLISLSSFIFFFFPIILKWGLPLHSSAELIVSVVVHKLPFSMTTFENAFGLFLGSFFPISFILCFFSFVRDRSKKGLLFLLWFLSLFIFFFISFFNISLIPHRFLYFSVYPLIFLTAYSINEIFNSFESRYSKLFLILVIIFLLSFQVSEGIKWHREPEKDVMTSEHYDSLLWIRDNTLETDRVITDQWSAYHISAVSRREVLYSTGLYTNITQRVNDIIKIISQGDEELIKKYDIKYIYVYDTYTKEWFSSRVKIDKTSSSKIIDTLAEKNNFVKVYENGPYKTYKITNKNVDLYPVILKGKWSNNWDGILNQNLEFEIDEGNSDKDYASWSSFFTDTDLKDYNSSTLVIQFNNTLGDFKYVEITFGSDTSNVNVYREYQSKNNVLLFDLNNPYSVRGNTDWEEINYLRMGVIEDSKFENVRFSIKSMELIK